MRHCAAPRLTGQARGVSNDLGSHVLKTAWTSTTEGVPDGFTEHPLHTLRLTDHSIRQKLLPFVFTWQSLKSYELKQGKLDPEQLQFRSSNSR